MLPTGRFTPGIVITPTTFFQRTIVSGKCGNGTESKRQRYSESFLHFYVFRE
jgi:hypothetical protein